MTQRATAKLACRCMALWFFAQAVIDSVPVVIFLVTGAFMGGGRGQLLGALLSAVMPVVLLHLGLLLWVMSDGIAQRMVGDQRSSPVTPLDVRSATSVAAVAIGLLLAIPAIGELVSAAYLAIRYDEACRPSGVGIEAVLGGAVQLTLSLFLILGSRAIATAIHRARTYQGPAIDDTSSD